MLILAILIYTQKEESFEGYTYLKNCEVKHYYGWRRLIVPPDFYFSTAFASVSRQEAFPNSSRTMRINTALIKKSFILIRSDIAMQRIFLKNIMTLRCLLT